MKFDIVDLSTTDEDVAALQRLRLFRRRYRKAEKAAFHAERKAIKALLKLADAEREVETRGLDLSDPRSLDD